jgi:cytochrome c oxidase cbb3-type subunit 3
MSSEPGEIPELPRKDDAERDGIGEEDNPIPLWFNVTFLASIAFAVVYALYYLFSGWSQEGQYHAEVERAQAAVAEARASMPTSNPYAGDPAAIAEGKVVFEQICAACHKPDGSGMVGPSLVDPYWKYGSSDEARFTSVMQGRPGGMPPWGPQLGSEKVWKVLAYVDTLPKSDRPGVGAPAETAAGAAPGGGS